MQPGRFMDHRRRGGGGGAADADYVVTGFVAVVTAVSFLLFAIVGRDAPAGTAIAADGAWQVVLAAFATMSAGLLFIMHGMRVRDARPPAVVRRAVDAGGAVLWHAGGPERRLLLVVTLFICPVLEAWFDFI